MLRTAIMSHCLQLMTSDTGCQSAYELCVSRDSNNQHMARRRIRV